MTYPLGGDATADRAWMRLALALAERGWGRVAPNPMVGAVVVRDGRVVGEGFHSEYGRAHAEVEALRTAGESARGATLYVTLEPCNHHGKTPPCTEAILRAGLQRVVFAAPDPNPVAAGGAERLRAAGVEVTGGVEAEAARELNGAFFHGASPHGAERPWTLLKLALSLDGRMADRTGRSGWITGPEAREEVHRMRAGFDAIAVGIGTVLADDPRLSVRGPVEPRVPPVRVVFDRGLRLPPRSRLASTAREISVWAVGAPDAPGERRGDLESRGVRVLLAPDLAESLRLLRSEGIGSLFCEGGARLAGALLAGGYIDRLALFFAPLLLGPDGPAPFAALGNPPLDEAARWRHLGSSVFGSDTLIHLAHPSPCSPD